MGTGFYKLSKLDETQLRSFFKDAIFLSYNTHIDILDINKSISRERCVTKTIQDMLNGVSIRNHNVCIDRSIQYENEKYGEIGYSTLKSPDYFLYIFVGLDNLRELIKKYDLEESFLK
jgi:hypothetical protein